MQPVVQIEQMRKIYGQVVAVDDVSLTVNQGEILGLVGPNGAGKTTIVECLTGLRNPDSGTVRALGLDPRQDGRKLRQRIGIQLQQAALPEDIKVWEALDLYASFYEHAAEWEPLLADWGLDAKRESRFKDLSGGQKQRLFIALALVNEPELVFLDEITTGLDPQARRATWDLIRGIRERGTTVVLVTHFMDEAEQLCDRVAIVDGGRIVANESPHGLIQRIQSGVNIRISGLKVSDVSFLREIPEVSELEAIDGDILVSGNGSLLSSVAVELDRHGLEPADLRLSRPTLEDVFLQETGRTLRD